MRHIDKVIVREYIGVEALKGAPLVEGFASVGMSSALAAGYLVEALGLPQVADIISDDFPAIGDVTKYKMGSGCRIYGDKRLAVIVSDFKISDSNPTLQRSLVAAIYDFAYRHKCKFMVTVEGLRDNEDEDGGNGISEGPEHAGGDDDDDEDGGGRPPQQPLKVKLDLNSDKKKKSKKKKTEEKKADASDEDKSKDAGAKKDGAAEGGATSKKSLTRKKSKDKGESGKEQGSGDEEEGNAEMLWYISTDPVLSKKTSDMGYGPLKDAIITGVSGGIISEACTSTLPVIALISDSTSISDVENAVSIVQIIDNLLGRDKIDTQKLEAEIKRIKEEIDKAVEFIKSATRDKHKDTAASMYL